LPEPPESWFQYRPELSEWITPDAKNRGRHTFTIKDEATGATIATVQINPALNATSALAIESLLTNAPEVWRALWEEARWMLMNQTSMYEDFRDLAQLLWDACGRAPFGPAEPLDDIATYEKNSKAVAQHLAATGKGARHATK
jgi:hypothetical protein